MRPPRLYVETVLAPGMRIEPRPATVHYLLRVLRLAAGSAVRLFNARDGEWLARLTRADKQTIQLLVSERLRAPAPTAGPVLFVAPPRRRRFEWLVEKATELGVSRIVPILTRRGVAKPERLERLQAIATEAAEQSERLDVPVLEPLCSWSEFLERVRAMPLLFADEQGGEALLTALARSPDAALLVGPEGGFEAAEREVLRGLPGVMPVSLGPRILRVETAALAMLACRAAVIQSGGAR